MKACKVELKHASEAEQLNGIGPKLCKRLAEKHIEHCNEHGLPLPKKPTKRSRAATDMNVPSEQDTETQQPPAKQRKQKEYVPKRRTGAYALLIALSESEQDGNRGLSKEDLKAKAQPFCESSFTIPDTSKYYTAWKGMDTLLEKELVCVRGGSMNKRYCLTDEGWSCANRMRTSEGLDTHSCIAPPAKKASTTGPITPVSGNANTNRSNANPDIVNLDSDSDVELQRTPLRSTISIKDSGPSAQKSPAINSTDVEPISIRPGTFEVKLLLDSREIQGKKNRDYIADELRKQKIQVEVRALPLGDVLWIAKVKSPYGSALKLRNVGDDEEGSDEIVLEHVVERKRLDDLLSSLKDGRFHEQKFRLKRSGMRHVTYLIEQKSLSADTQETYGQSMESAIAQMQVVDDIFVKQTAKVDETIKYLARMTTSLKRMYEQKELLVLPSTSLDIATHHKILTQLRQKSPSEVHCITFSAFCALCDKSESLTLRDLYLKMLMCMRGVTSDKAIEIQKIWPTPNAFVEAYSNLRSDAAAKKRMVSDRLGKEIPRKQVAATLSAGIAEVWGS